MHAYKNNRMTLEDENKYFEEELSKNDFEIKNYFEETDIKPVVNIITSRSSFIDSFGTEYLVCRNNYDKYGIEIYHNGEIYLDYEYDYIELIDKDYILVGKGGLYSVLDRKLNTVIDYKYTLFSNKHERMRRVAIGDKYGYINEMMFEQIPTIYDSVGKFKNGFACVGLNGKKGYIDIRGNVVVDFLYDDGEDFNNNQARVMVNGKWGVIDNKGKVIVPILYNKFITYNEYMNAIKRTIIYG